MGKVLTLLHTTPVVINLIGSLVKEIIPGEVTVRTVVDDSLLNDTRKAGHLTKEVIRRVVAQVQLAENSGSDCVLFTCSSVGPAIDVARLVVNIPVLKIDEPMAGEAVRLGSSIAVLATVPTTLGPTKALIEQAGSALGKQVGVDTVLCSDAFDALGKGDVKLHNDLLMKRIEAAASSHDVIVLAQASMSNIIPDLPSALRSKVLTSPRLGLEYAARVMAEMKD